jgi:hypothetical protein
MTFVTWQQGSLSNFGLLRTYVICANVASRKCHPTDIFGYFTLLSASSSKNETLDLRIMSQWFYKCATAAGILIMRLRV